MDSNTVDSYVVDVVTVEGVLLNPVCQEEIYNPGQISQPQVVMFGITQDRNIRVVCGKDKLCFWLELSDQLDHVLRLVDYYHVVVPLAQHKQNQRRCTLTQRVVL